MNYVSIDYHRQYSHFTVLDEKGFYSSFKAARFNGSAMPMLLASFFSNRSLSEVPGSRYCLRKRDQLA